MSVLGVWLSRTISIHAPRVGSDRSSVYLVVGSLDISIHAPRVGSDYIMQQLKVIKRISIHVPRVGSDGADRGPDAGVAYFNPRSPCGERLC